MGDGCMVMPAKFTFPRRTGLISGGTLSFPDLLLGSIMIETDHHSAVGPDDR